MIRDRMVAAWLDRGAVMLDKTDFIQTAIIGINALEAKALLWLELVEINFFAEAFVRRVILIMLVRRHARPVAGRRNDFDDKQALRNGVDRRNDIMNMALPIPHAAPLITGHLWGNQRWLGMLIGLRARHRDFHICYRLNLIPG